MALPPLEPFSPWSPFPRPILGPCTTAEAMGAMALLPICNTSFTCEDYNTFRAHPWSPSFLRRAHPGPGPHSCTLREALISVYRGTSHLRLQGYLKTPPS